VAAAVLDEPAAEENGVSAPRRRGRRPAGEDTKSALLKAARAVFNEQGYTRATVRTIAATAGVDPAMVNHWFGSKEGLFAVAVRIPINPEQVLAHLLEGDRESIAERMLRTFLQTWDNADGGILPLMRSLSSHDEAATMLREFITTVLFGPLAKTLGVDRPDLRAALCGSQISGLGLTRYVLRLEPLASADHDTIVATIAPTLQRYLTGDLGLPA
jgi:AcrR family transcriptional regulator